MATRDQTRAADAARLVGGEEARAHKARYNSLAHSLPVLIRQNGLLQAAAYLKSKAHDKKGKPTAEGVLYDHVKDQLSRAGYLDRRKDLVEFLTEADHGAYRLSQEEAVRCTGWHKRFSRALFGVPESDADQTGAES